MPKEQPVNPSRRAAPAPQKSDGLTLPALREQLQPLLACWCGHCPLCGRDVPELLKAKPP